MSHLPKKWALKSLTIGPQSNETDIGFWEEAFKDLPPLPGVDNVTIIYNYPSVKAFNTSCWEYFDRTLTRRDLFPALKKVHVQSSCRSLELSSQKWWNIHASLRTIRWRGLGPCKLLAFRRGHWTDARRRT
jgi:hypothetical protein